MAKRKFNFTKKALEAIEVPLKGGVEFMDASCKGLRLMVQQTGSKTFYYRGGIAGACSQKRFRLGVFPDMSIDEARSKADQMRIDTGKGVDPLALVKEAKVMPTLDDFFQHYLEEHSKKQKKTWEYDAKAYSRHLKEPLGNMKLSAIKRLHVAAMHADVAERSGKSMANHVLALLTAVFNKARQWDVLKTPSPTEFVQKYPEPPRKRRLDEAEMQRVLQTLMEEVNTDLRDYALIALFTGVRRGNVLSMRWEHIDWNTGIWNIPMTKNGEPISVPLNEILVTLLRQRRSVMESEFVFPSDSQQGHLLELRRSWAAFIKRAGIINFTPHDLRRTYATWLGKTGASSFVISKSLGQKDLKSATVYTHLNVTDVTKSSEIAVSEMLGTVFSKIDEKIGG